MRRRWNWMLWIGFLVVVVALFSYPFFVLFPATRDFPWVNLLLFCAGGVLLAFGLTRSFRQAEIYRGRVFGPILAVLSLLGFSLFAYGVFYEVRQLPRSPRAPQVGQKAPDFALPNQDGEPMALADLLTVRQWGTTSGAPKAVLLIFYRGYW